MRDGFALYWRSWTSAVVGLWLVMGACGSSGSGGGHDAATGGAGDAPLGSGGLTASGDATVSGGASGSGGATAVGGSSGKGGATGIGGATAVGSSTSKGGANGSGGAGGTIPTAGFSCAADVRTLATATYFVDFDGGNDASNGRTQATAWKRAPGDNAATGLAAAATLASGDVVLFKGGVVYKGAITVPASGSASAPIVYTGDSGNAWGTGLAVISGEATRTQGFVLQGKSFVLIDGFELRAFSKSSSSTAISIDGGASNEVRYCRISDVYYPTNPGGTSWEKQSGTGIAVNNSPLSRVRHNTVRDVGNAGITFTAGSGKVIDGGEVSCNEVTNMNWGIAVALGNSTAGTKITGVKLLGNTIHDFDQYYACNAWHRDGIFVFARPDSAETSVENLEIAYNYFEDNTSALGSTAWLYIEYVCKGFNIHHNVLNASRSYYAIRVLGDGFQVAGNHVFANNVIANANGIGDGMHIQESSGIQILNNIFYDDGNAYLVATSSMAGFFADYNLIYRVGGSGPVVGLNTGPAESPGGDTYDLATLKSKTAFEQHGIAGDPQFSASFTTVDSDPSGFAPKASSSAIDHGSNLGYTSDFAGKPVPAGSAADIGAFELQP